MTKAPESNGKVEAVLSEERISNIGWFFITSYYEYYTTSLDNIHKIYHPKASLSHGGFPTESEAGTIHKARGTEAILARFKNDPTLKDDNYIVINSAAFEVSQENNILIVVFGDWAKGDSRYYPFTQTFLLVPGLKETVLDVANDVLRFVDPETKDKKIKQQEAQAAAAATAEAPVETTPAETVEPEAVEPEAVAAEETAPEEEKEEPETEPESSEPPAASKDSEEDNTLSTEQSEPKEKSPETEDSTPEPSAPSTPSQPLSWAALASQAAPKTGAKPVPTPGVTKAAPVKKAAPTTSNNKNSHFKKEEWYPIYIRGVKQVDEKALRDHISKKFGELKFFKFNLNIALCDFVSHEAQRKALDARETVIDGNTIYLEPRESKTGNNYHAGPKKFKDQKEKVGVVDPKRKADKKVPAKKPTKPVGKTE